MKNQEFKGVEFCIVTYNQAGQELAEIETYAKSVSEALQRAEADIRIMSQVFSYVAGNPKQPFPVAMFKRRPDFDIAKPEDLEWRGISKPFLVASGLKKFEQRVPSFDIEAVRKLVESLVWSDHALREALLTGYAVSTFYGAGRQSKPHSLTAAVGIGGQANKVARASITTKQALLAITTHFGLGDEWGRYHEREGIEVQEVASTGSATLRAAMRAGARAKATAVITYLDACGHTELCQRVKAQADL